MAKDGEVAPSFQPLLGVSRSLCWGLMKAKWPIPWSRPQKSNTDTLFHTRVAMINTTSWVHCIMLEDASS